MLRSPTCRTIATVAAILGLLATACAGSSSPGAAPASTASPTTDAANATTSTGTAGTTTTLADPPPEQFSGSVDDFYVVPSPLPKGRPGQLIRVQPVKQDADTVTLRVMYHSVDERKRDRAVTGWITYPKADPPAGGWPVVSWDHGTTGLGPSCAPSRYDAGQYGFGVQGVWVATDYIGLGPVGERHAYLGGLAEAHSAIDAVRAARLLPDAHAGTRWVDVGHSQGGHAALWTNQLGASYAPELQLLGTAVLAPAAVFDRTFGPQDQLIPRMVQLLGLFGMAAEYPQIKLDDYLGPKLIPNQHVVDTGCMNEIIKAFAGIPGDEFYAQDPTKTEPAKSIIAANDPGHVKAASPLLLVGGTADTWVVPARVDALFDQLCGVDQVTERLTLPGATHDTEVKQGWAQIGAWLQARIDGRPATDDC